MGEVDGLRLILTDLYIPVLTPRFLWAETAFHFSENKTLFAICCIYTFIIGKDG